MTLTYDYDADGNRTGMDDSMGGLVSYTYDARDELINETLSGSGISAEAVKNAYDNAGNMTEPDALLEPGGDDGRGIHDVIRLRQCRAVDRDHRQELGRHDAGVVRLHLRRGRAGEPGSADVGFRDSTPTR